MIDNTDGFTDGTILADGAGSQVQITGSTIKGGILSTTNGGIILGTGSVILDGSSNILTNQGSTYGVNNYTTTTLKGDINNTGEMQVNSIASPTSLLVSGTVNLDGGGTVKLSNHTANRFAGDGGSDDTLINVNNIIQGAGQLGDGTMTLTNMLGGTIHANEATALTINMDGTTFSNAGTLKASGSGGLNLLDTDVTNTGTVEAVNSTVDVTPALSSYTQNAGLTKLDNGTLEAGTITFTGGSLTGSGNVNGTSVGPGPSITFGPGATISPGFSAGILFFNDDSVFEGLINIELGGLLPGGLLPGEYDRIEVTGEADLQPGLEFNVSLIDGFNPFPGNTFDIFTATTILGSIEDMSFIFPAFSGGYLFASIVDLGGSSAVRLGVEPAVVPVPPSLVLLFSALTGLIGYHRWRRQPA